MNGLWGWNRGPLPRSFLKSLFLKILCLLFLRLDENWSAIPESRRIVEPPSLLPGGKHEECHLAIRCNADIIRMIIFPIRIPQR